jgi:hypothetical protein
MSYFYDDMYGGSKSRWLYGGEPEAGQASAEAEAKNKKKKRAHIPYPHDKVHCSREGQRNFTGDRHKRQLYKNGSCDKLHSARTSANEKKRLTPKQATRRAFVKGRHGFGSLEKIRTGGHLVAKKDLRRIKHGRYAVNVKRPVTVQLLAWNDAHQAAADAGVKTDEKGHTIYDSRGIPARDVRRYKWGGKIVRPKKDGNAQEQKLYNDTLKKYNDLIQDDAQLAMYRNDVEKSKREVEAHNAALYKRTGGHNSHVWRVAKFQVDRDEGKRNYPARQMHDFDAPQSQYYGAVDAEYDLLMKDRAGEKGEKGLKGYEQAVKEYVVAVKQRKGKDAVTLARERRSTHGAKAARAKKADAADATDARTKKAEAAKKKRSKAQSKKQSRAQSKKQPRARAQKGK